MNHTIQDAPYDDPEVSREARSTWGMLLGLYLVGITACSLVPQAQAQPHRTAPGRNTSPRIQGYQSISDSTDGAGSKRALLDLLPQIEILFQVRTNLFENKEAGNTSTYLRKAEIGFSGRINRWMDFKIELDPARPNDPFRRTFIRFTPSEFVDIRYGQEKAPIGMEELMRTSRIPFVDRSAVNDRFAPAEELGMIVYLGSEPVQLGVAITDGRGRQTTANQRDDNTFKDVTGRLAYRPREWIELGGARMDGRTGSDEQKRNRTNLSLRLGDPDNLQFVYGEYYRAVDGAVTSDAYHAAAGKGIRIHHPLLEWIVPAVRFEQITQDGPAHLLDELSLLTVGINLWFTNYGAKIQINYVKDIKTDGLKDHWRFQYQIRFG